ncbi:putative Ran GTPase activator [Rhodotorula toruloides ATCC 204091]|nr:putative Ran GTPase activator [Rhodotorula toruloides ATCC 204091]KAK4333041.1 Ran GTPase-activating protein 1 [Rhodotorula toruloides]
MTTFTLGHQLKLDSLEHTQPHLDRLRQLGPNVEEVRFGGNTLGIEACEGVAKELEDKRELRIADFSDIFTGRLITEIPQSLRALCTSLLTLPLLTELDLSDNAFGGRSAEPMLDFISSAPSLEILRLNNNGMGPQGGAMIAGALLENAKKAEKEGRKSKLRVLVCEDEWLMQLEDGSTGRNRLENGSAPDFAAAFSALTTLAEVRMPQNGIRMEGIEAIVKGLQKNPNLQWLDLQDNTATEKGSRAIAESLPFWPKLRILNLSDCLLRPRGGLSIFTTLLSGSNPLLTSLKLQSNELDTRAITQLAAAIALHGEHLTDLELNGNYGVDGTEEEYEKVREALGKWDHEDALDELDELEEPEEEEEEEESEKEAEVEEEEEKPEVKEETKEEKKEEDELAGLMDKVHIA